MIKEKIKKRKLLMIMVLITIFAFILGVFFISVLSDANKDLVKSSINNYFNGIYEGEMDYLKSLYSVITNNLFLGVFIWIIGISIIGIIIVGFILLFKSFLVGFSFTSILYTYGFKGIPTAIIYILPEVINLFILFVLVYYSISFSCLLFNHLFRKKEYNKKVIVNRYLKLLVISVLLLVVSSLVSVFLIPNVLRMF